MTRNRRDPHAPASTSAIRVPAHGAAGAPGAAAPGRRRFLQSGALGGALAASLPVSGCGGDDGSVPAPAPAPAAAPLPTAPFADERRILSEPLLQNPRG